MFNLLYPVVDFDADKDTYEQYDTMSAYDLFKQWGVSKDIYEKFLKPTCRWCVCVWCVWCVCVHVPGVCMCVACNAYSHVP